jgi:hypothetical protein
MGIDEHGQKQMLDFSVGSTESAEVVGELPGRLKRRGFRVRGRFLTIRDSSPSFQADPLGIHGRKPNQSKYPGRMASYSIGLEEDA